MRQLCLVFLGLASCGSDVPGNLSLGSSGDTPQSAVGDATLSFDPARSADQVEPVTAINVEFSGGKPDEVSPYVIAGEVSQVSIGKLASGELTSALAERIVPSISRALVNGWRIRPEVPLQVGNAYSVVSKYGLHGVFWVGSATNAFLTRMWPSANSGACLGIFCGDVAPTEFTDMHLDGSNIRAKLLPGLNDEGFRSGSCVRVAWGTQLSGVVQPPPALSQFSFDPSVLPTSPIASEPSDLVCSTTEIRFAPGCALPQPGAIVVRPPSGDTLWGLQMNDRYHLQPTKDGQRFIIPELGVQRKVELSVTVFDSAGRSSFTRVQVELPPPAAHFVISEVMANPVGPEPEQEWIEVVNAGTHAGDLAELNLHDSEGGFALPSMKLEPGEFALIVREDYDGTAYGDVPIPTNAHLVRVAQLGRNGLSNAGKL